MDENKPSDEIEKEIEKAQEEFEEDIEDEPLEKVVGEDEEDIKDIDEKVEEKTADSDDKPEEEKSEEKELEKQEDKDKKPDFKKPFEKIQENQAKILMIIMVLIIAGVFIISWTVSESRTFEHEGLEWEKEMFGKIPIYTTKIQGYRSNARVINFNLILRNDPRKLDIPIDGEIKMNKEGPVYFSMNLDDELNSCGTLALVNFGRFMAGMGFDSITAVTTEDLSKQYGRPHVDCTNNQEDIVIMFKNGEETSIKQVRGNENCYIVTVNNCEDLEALETLEVAILTSLLRDEISE